MTSAGPKTAQHAEQLWVRAHQLVHKNDLANAIRDLAACFEILQTLRDPRLYEVHKRWTELHQLYVRRAKSPPSSMTSAQASSQSQQARASASASASVSVSASAQKIEGIESVVHAAVEQAETTTTTEAPLKTQTAPVMAQTDAPVAMHSLEVAVSVGDAISQTQAAQVSVVGGPSLLPEAALPREDGAALQELLARVQKNRRAPSLFSN